MYFSTFMFIIAICIVMCGYFKYQQWAKKQDLQEKFSQDKELMEMYEEYQEFLKKHPDFEQKKKIIQKLIERTK